jgi:peroxiredoxin Q/BCP
VWRMRFCLPLLAFAFVSVASWASAAPLAVGDPAPAITATSEAGAPVDFAKVYKQQKYTLVYFYPKAFTGGCTKQGCSLRDANETLTQKGVTIIGVSIDDVDTQKRFKEENHFPFTLVADTDQKVMQAFGVPPLKTGAASRQAYLVKDGKVVYADHKGATTTQADEILAFIAKDGS